MQRKKSSRKKKNGRQKCRMKGEVRRFDKEMMELLSQDIKETAQTENISLKYKPEVFVRLAISLVMERTHLIMINMNDTGEYKQHKVTEDVHAVVKPGHIVGKLVELNQKEFSVIYWDSLDQINRENIHTSYVFLTKDGFIIDDVPAECISVEKRKHGATLDYCPRLSITKGRR